MQNLICDIIEYCMIFLNYEDIKSFMLSSKIFLIFKNSQIYLKKEIAYHKIPSCFVKLRINWVSMQEYNNDKIRMQKDIANIKKFSLSRCSDSG